MAATPPPSTPTPDQGPSKATKFLVFCAIIILLLGMLLFLVIFFYRKSQRRRKKKRIDVEKQPSEDKLRAALKLPPADKNTSRIKAPEISLKAPKSSRRSSDADADLGVLDAGFRWLDSGGQSDGGGIGSLFGKGKLRKYSSMI